MGGTASRARHAGRLDRAAQNNEHLFDEPIDDLDGELEDVDGLTAEQRLGLVEKGQNAIAEAVGDVRERAGEKLTGIRDDAAFVRSTVDIVAQEKWDAVDEELGVADRLGEDSEVYAAIEGAFTRVVSGAVTLLVGIYVFAQISGTMPTPENSQLANSTETVVSTTGQAFTLGAVAIIVLIASVILGLVGSFGGAGRRRRR